jgi:hypothetical protein
MSLSMFDETKMTVTQIRAIDERKRKKDEAVDLEDEQEKMFAESRARMEKVVLEQAALNKARAKRLKPARAGKEGDKWFTPVAEAKKL